MFGVESPTLCGRILSQDGHVLPQFDDMLKTLVGEPSVSSLSPDIDRSNLAVIEHLAALPIPGPALP